jgi:uncharacterized protein YjiS (DUF1127 family)
MQKRLGTQPMTVAARQKADEASLGEIRRCTVVDMSEWGPWLLGCLVEKWPTIGDGSLFSKIRAWSASNEFLFIRNDLAVLLAIVMHDNVDGRPYVRAMFAFARDGAPQSSAGEHAIVALYRRMREWAKSMRATRVYFSGRSDIGLSRRQTLLSAEKETEIFSTIG